MKEMRVPAKLTGKEFLAYLVASKHCIICVSPRGENKDTGYGNVGLVLPNDSATAEELSTWPAGMVKRMRSLQLVSRLREAVVAIDVEPTSYEETETGNLTHVLWKDEDGQRLLKVLVPFQCSKRKQQLIDKYLSLTYPIAVIASNFYCHVRDEQITEQECEACQQSMTSICREREIPRIESTIVGVLRRSCLDEHGCGGFQMQFVEPCPYCGVRHLHGPGFGHRSSHCGRPKINDNRGYILVPIADPVTAAKDAQIIKLLNEIRFLKSQKKRWSDVVNLDDSDPDKVAYLKEQEATNVEITELLVEFDKVSKSDKASDGN